MLRPASRHRLIACLWCLLLPLQVAAGPVAVESALLADRVAGGKLPPVSKRLPKQPLVVDLEAKGRKSGTQGGTLRTMVARSKDVRQMVVFLSLIHI